MIKGFLANVQYPIIYNDKSFPLFHAFGIFSTRIPN